MGAPWGPKIAEFSVAQGAKSLFEPLGAPSLDFFDFLPPKNSIWKILVFNIAQKRPKTA